MTLSNNKQIDCSSWGISNLSSPRINDGSHFSDKLKLVHVDQFGNFGTKTKNLKESLEMNLKQRINSKQLYGYWPYKKLRGQSMIIPIKLIQQVNFERQRNSKILGQTPVKKQYLYFDKKYHLKRRSSEKIKNNNFKIIKSKTEHNEVRYKRTFASTLYYDIKCNSTKEKCDINKITVREQINSIRDKGLKSMNFASGFEQNVKKRLSVNELLFFRSDKTEKKREMIEKKFRNTLKRAKIIDSLIEKQQ